MEDIPTTYNQKKEPDIYKKWEESGYFSPEGGSASGGNPDNLSGKPFTITMPPPNATGVLHIGHAFECSLQDMMIRYHRMKGEKALWVPGTDHAAIATNTKVEKILQKEEGKNRHDIGREAFVKKVEEFVEESRGVILKQLRSLGTSADWSREAFTLDEQRSLAVRTAFKRMFDAGLIYRGIRVINWDPKGQTAVSDDEVVYKTEKGKLYTFRYSKDFPISIATTRPETKVGDTAVAVNPKDKRYKQYVGKEYEVEFAGAKLKLKVIADESIDQEFGTGAVGVTPAHSIVDFELSQKHGLPALQVINEFAKMTNEAGSLAAGQKTKEARETIVKWLSENSLLEKEEEIDLNLSTAQRSGGVIEPLPKLQWFVDVNKKVSPCHPEAQAEGSYGILRSAQNDKVSLKDLMHEAVASGKIKIIPERFEKTYFHWIDNLRDWNISRQLWYGHRIPVWYCGGLEKASLPRMGFHKDVVPEVFKGKTRTYRLRDHGLKIGDRFALEDSGTKNLIRFGTITNVIQTTVGEIALPDEKHSGKYKTTAELIEKGFKKMHPEKEITEQTPAWIYDYEIAALTENCGQIIASIDEPKKCPACGGTNLVQDPDTLDTWFSSALWTFSTLGWPKETSDLKTFHPTNVMSPGYEILFFWVARMILMSTFLLGEIPFQTVYLHGMVRDITGKKFSKSADNGIDPLEIIEKYGADALRMGLNVGVGPGNDSKYDEMKIKGYRNFANKIWNASRFVLQNRGSGPRVQGEVLPEHQKILDEQKEIIKDATRLMDNLDFSHAAENLYHYFWHEFADNIIENSKKDLADPLKKESAQIMLLTLLENNLKLLHPFMPFVTEAVWELFHKDLLMVQKWPGDIEQITKSR